jgi:hypothetical protein
MEMVVDQRPGEAVGLSGDEQIRKPLYEPVAVALVGEDLALLDPAHDDVLQEIGDVDAGGAWHGGRIAGEGELFNVLRTSPWVVNVLRTSPWVVSERPLGWSRARIFLPLLSRGPDKC